MKNKVLISSIVAAMLIVAVFGLLVVADKPDKNGKDTGHIWEELLETGLQGEHYTLNIHGKKDGFSGCDTECSDGVDNDEDGKIDLVNPDPECASAEDDDESLPGNQYSNNIFVPSNSEGSENEIWMISGNKKGKWAKTGNTLYGVRDGCTAPFDGDEATLVIPPNENGYFVTARVLGKPTDDPSISLEGELLFVLDEDGNDLLVLGLVTSNGFALPGTTLTRTKGNVKMVDISALFHWSGSVCYFNVTNYCWDGLVYTCTNRSVCCNETACIDALVNATTNVTYCEEGYDLFVVGCKAYTKKWVFNIGDLVGYMWDTDTAGNFKLANIRFYPIPD